MTQEEKELLLKDLCARLPYGVKCKVHLDTKGYCLRDGDKYCDDTLESVNYIKQTCTFNQSIGYNFGDFVIEGVKPYLRPMSSITEEELKELAYKILQQPDLSAVKNYKTLDISFTDLVKVMEWLNAHHFDYRGLIEKGLALEAPEGMYK